MVQCHHTQMLFSFLNTEALLSSYQNSSLQLAVVSILHLVYLLLSEFWLSRFDWCSDRGLLWWGGRGLALIRYSITHIMIGSASHAIITDLPVRPVYTFIFFITISQLRSPLHHGHSPIHPLNAQLQLDNTYNMFHWCSDCIPVVFLVWGQLVLILFVVFVVVVLILMTFAVIVIL